MAKLMLNGEALFGSYASDIIDITREEYDRLPTSQKNNDKIYNITDEDVDLVAAAVDYDHTDSGLNANTVQSGIDELTEHISGVGLEIPNSCDTFEKLYALSDWLHYKPRMIRYDHPTLHTPDNAQAILFISGGIVTALTHMGNIYRCASDKPTWERVNVHEYHNDGKVLDVEHVSSVKDILSSMAEQSRFVLDTWTPLTDYPMKSDGYWKLEVEKCVDWKNYATIKLTYSFDSVTPIREWFGKCDQVTGVMTWAEIMEKEPIVTREYTSDYGDTFKFTKTGNVVLVTCANENRTMFNWGTLFRLPKELIPIIEVVPRLSDACTIGVYPNGDFNMEATGDFNRRLAFTYITAN